MFRTPVPRQQAQYAELFERLLGTQPPEGFLDAFHSLIRDHSYQEYRLNLHKGIALCRDLVSNVADREFLWYGPWSTVMDFRFRAIGLHVIPQYPLWRLQDGGSHPQLNEQGKKSIVNWRTKMENDTEATTMPVYNRDAHNPSSPSDLISSGFHGRNSSTDQSSFDFSSVDIPPVEPSSERLDEIELEVQMSLSLERLQIDQPDASQGSDSTSQFSTARTAEVSLPVIDRERGDNSLVADFACLTLQGISMRDVLGADDAPPPNVQPSSRKERGNAMNEELNRFFDGLGRRIQENQPKTGRRLGCHLDLARVLLLLEAKRDANSKRHFENAMLESVAQVEEQACYCFDMPNVSRLVAIASVGDIWQWTILGRSENATTKDKKGRKMAAIGYKGWSKRFSLETQESEDQWDIVVKVVSDLLEEAEVDVML